MISPVMLAVVLAAPSHELCEGVRIPTLAAPGSPLMLSAPRTQVAYSESSGVLWARGRNYKASAGSEGFTFIPFLGSAAPRNWPVRFEVEGARLGGEPLLQDGLRPRISREASAFVIKRGAVEARYVMGIDSVEQTFLVRGVAGQSRDLTLDVQVDTDLEARAVDDGWLLEGPDGSVTFGAATVLDSEGRAQGIETRVESGRLRFTVPAAFLARATGPILIDPVIATADLDGFVLELTRPDVAYDGGSDTYLVAYEEAFSATDGDVYSRTFDARSLAVVEEEYVDMTSARASQPKVASDAGESTYLAVIMREDTNGLVSLIGRVQDAGTAGGWGAEFPVATPDEFFERLDHDVGGSAFSATTATGYIVLWERRPRGGGATPSRIEGRRLTGSGAFMGGYFDVSRPTVTRSLTRPRVSKIADGEAPRSWMAAWFRAPTSEGLPYVAYRRISPVTNALLPKASYIFGASLDDVVELDVTAPRLRPGIGTTSSVFMERRDGPVHRSVAWSGLLTDEPNDGLWWIRRAFTETDLIDLGAGGTRRGLMLADLSSTSAVAYYDASVGEDTAVRMSSIDYVAGARHAVGERRVILGTLNRTLGVSGGAASEYSEARPNSQRALFAWQDEGTPGADQDIFGALVDLNGPPAIGGVVTCGGTRNSSGDFGFLGAYGNNSTVSSKVLRASALPQNTVGYFLASRTLGNGVIPPASSGSLCLGGSIGRYAQLPQSSGNGGRFEISIDPSAIIAPMGLAQAQSGETWFFQAWYRDQGQGPTSNFTNAVAVEFL